MIMSASGLVHVINVDTGRIQWQLGLPSRSYRVVTSICTTAGYIVIGYINGTVRIYNETTGHCMHELEAHVRGIRSMSANNGLLATTSGSRNVRVWDLDKGKLRYEWASKYTDIVCLSRLGDMVVVGMKNGSIHKFWINKRKVWFRKKCCCL